MASLARVPLSRIFRIVVAVALTAYILRKAHPADILRVTGDADWRWIGAAVALLFVDRTLMAYRWMVLLCALTPGTRPPFRAVLRIFFVSTFVGTFLPSVGGDLYRAYSLSRLDVSGVESAASVLMDRVLGVMAIVIVGVLALIPAPPRARNPWMLLTLALGSLGCLVAGVVVFSERAATAGQAIAARLSNPRARRIAGGMIESVRRYGRHHRELLNVLGLSVGVQMVRVVQAWCLGRALGIEAGLVMYFIFIPIVLLIMLLPITVSGLGTSQGAFSWLFGTIGVPPAASVALSILFVALGVIGNLPGGLLYVFGGREVRQTA
ncbi:MAG: glycosyltransferase 2 family protein [Acidobacteriota bacterium]